jgi:SAM-dependent methyltransferase
MFTKSARFYDALYEFKDYAGTAAHLRTMIRELHPQAKTLLDVACGSGRHLELLRADYDVTGLDLGAELLRVARERLPDVPLHEADMRSFELGRTFDVVTCMFSSIGYARTADGMRAAVASMGRHVAPGGLLFIEPWFWPEKYWVGHLVANTVDRPDLRISWMYVSQVKDGVSVLDIHYQVGTPDGIEQFREVHEMGLFTDDEYRDAFRAAGLEPQYDPHGFFGRGLYYAQQSA